MINDSVLSRLASSRKAMILLVVVVALTILCALGKVSSTQLLTFLTVSLPAWLLAQGFEDGLVKPAAIVAATASADRAAGLAPASQATAPASTSTSVDVTVQTPEPPSGPPR